MNNPIIKAFKYIFYDYTYGIAYKKKDDDKYITILPTDRYAYADPFIIEYDGKTAIFVEEMDYHYGWGTIGVFEIDSSGQIGKLKEIIREKNHMSFPNVFIRNGELYMIPETYSANNVHLYKCLDFPYKWKKMNPLIENVHLVDHALLDCDGDTFIISYDLDLDSSRFFKLDWDKMIMEEFFPGGVYSNERPGGTFYYNANGELLRPIQDCKRCYGDFLKIYSVDECCENCFNEKLVKEIRIDDVSFDVNKGFEHIHQYSVSKNYEVIDFHYNRFYKNRPIRFLTRFIFHRNRMFR